MATNRRAFLAGGAAALAAAAATRGLGSASGSAVAPTGSGQADSTQARSTPSDANRRTPVGAAIGIAIPSFELDALDNQELARTMARIRSIGCSWLRFDVFWDAVQPSRGTFDWRSTQRLVDAAEQEQVQVLPVVHTTPKWLRPSGAPQVFGPTSPDDRVLFAEFCAAGAARFKGVVSAWEIWNEPNLIAFWSPSPRASDYAALLKAAHAAIKAVSSDLTVVSGGLGGPTRPGELDPESFVKAFLDAGAGGSFDALGLHPYTDLTGHVDGALGQVASTVELLTGRGISVPVWGTETGAPTAGTDGVVVTQAEQATILSTTYRYWRSLPDVGPLFWYTLNDTGTTSRYESFGLIGPDGAAKPALAALTAISRQS